MKARFDIVISTDCERDLPVQVTQNDDGTWCFWSALGCSRNYRDMMRGALVAHLNEHGRFLRELYT